MYNNIPQTPEAIAYQLMIDIFMAEGKIEDVNNQNIKFALMASREDILSTYKECLAIVNFSK